MSQKEKKKKSNKNFWRILLTVFIFGYIFFRTVPSLFAMAFKVVLPETTIIEDSIEAKALILKRKIYIRQKAMVI